MSFKPFANVVDSAAVRKISARLTFPYRYFEAPRVPGLLDIVVESHSALCRLAAVAHKDRVVPLPTFYERNFFVFCFKGGDLRASLHLHEHARTALQRTSCSRGGIERYCCT